MSSADKSGDVLDALIETTITERISYLKPIVEGKAPEAGGCRAANDEALARWIDLGLRYREQQWMNPDNATVELTPRGSAVAALSGAHPTVRRYDMEHLNAHNNLVSSKEWFPTPPVEVLDALAAENEFGGISSRTAYPNLNFADGTKYIEPLGGEICIIQAVGDLPPWVYGLGGYSDGREKYPKRRATQHDLEWANAHVYTEAAAG